MLWLLLAIVVFISGAIFYVSTFQPSVSEVPEIEIEASPEMIARGEYLANHVAVCVDCHSDRNWNYFAGPIISGTEGKGGEGFTEKLGFPGNFYAPNITPYHLKDWTDGEILRAMTVGVNKDGEPLFPIMPYKNYAQMPIEDLKAIIAYIRTLEPIEHDVKTSEASFPFSLILRLIPEDVDLPEEKPNKNNVIEYGKYLATVASCADCHSKQEAGQIVGEEFAGGFEFPLPSGGTVVSPNITPDRATGIGNWSEDMFVARFKQYQEAEFIRDTSGAVIDTVYKYSEVTVRPGEFQSMMPWVMYAGMQEYELRAIYRYLMTLKPVDNSVRTFIPPDK